MMFGLEYTIHADAIAIRQRWVAPGKYADALTAARVLKFEGSVVVAAMRSGFLYANSRTLQCDCLMIKTLRIGSNRMDGYLGCIGGRDGEDRQSHRAKKRLCCSAHWFEPRVCVDRQRHVYMLLITIGNYMGKLRKYDAASC
jgi:hypothetical protein